MSPRAKYFREQAAVCRRIAVGLSWNSPGHQQFLEMADGFDKTAAELELHSITPRKIGESRNQETEQLDSQDKPERD
jgi:hypothetical protein